MLHVMQIALSHDNIDDISSMGHVSGLRSVVWALGLVLGGRFAGPNPL